MRPRPPLEGRGIFTGTGLIIAGLTATLVALLIPIWSYADRSGTGLSVLKAGTVTTPYGPLSALDRDFVTKVRLAGLWELPAGQQAQQKGTTQAVRTAGQHLVEGHTFLDARVRDVASKLGLALPNEPNDQQKQWLATLDGAQGVDYDRQFANIARLAHGRVFPVVAEVRASTQNLPGPRPGRRRQHHRPRPHQGPGGHGIRRLRRPGPGHGRGQHPADHQLPRPARPDGRPGPGRSGHSVAVRHDLHPPPGRLESAPGSRAVVVRFRTNGTSHTDNTPSGS
ncbi:putative outer membrane protein [Streptomyces sp. SAI-041]|nr:putative outer membrane protein [Streptomyces sp. SAI-041]